MMKITAVFLSADEKWTIRRDVFSYESLDAKVSRFVPSERGLRGEVQ